MAKKNNQIEGQMSFFPIITKDNERLYMRNDFARGWQNLSLYSLKTVRLLISMVQKQDTHFNEYHAGVSVLAEELNTSRSAVSREADRITYELSHNALGVMDEEGGIKWIPYMRTAKYEKKGKKFILQLNDALEPYLIGLTGSFMCYEHALCMRFRTKNAIHVYELLISACNSERFPQDSPVNIFLSVKDIRFALAMDDYNEKGEFVPGRYYGNNGKLCEKVLDPAIRDIERVVTDHRITYKPHEAHNNGSVGRNAYDGFDFTITPKKLLVVDCTNYSICGGVDGQGTDICPQKNLEVQGKGNVLDEKKEQQKRTPVKKNSFNNFQQNDYDFDALEKALIANK